MCIYICVCVRACVIRKINPVYVKAARLAESSGRTWDFVWVPWVSINFTKHQSYINAVQIEHSLALQIEVNPAHRMWDAENLKSNGRTFEI